MQFCNVTNVKKQARRNYLIIASVKVPIFMTYLINLYTNKYEEKLTIILNINFSIINYLKLLMTFCYLK